MPAEILLPLFALTLLANAILVAVAIRGLRRGSTDGDHPGGGGPARTYTSTPPAAERPMTDQLAKAIASRRALVEGAASGPTAAPVPSPAAQSGVDDAAIPPVADPVANPVADPPATREVPAEVPGTPAAGHAVKPPPVPVPVPKRTVAKRRTTPDSKAGPPTRNDAEPPTRNDATRPSEPGRRSRRRFSLPPLDDDHEKVKRSIETFLGGAETPTADAPRSVERVAVGATTVALVAVDGLPPRRRRSRSTIAAVDDDATSNALAMVERTIRGAARGTDVVTVVDRGRFRIVLASTGEVAARAYLRRIRATVEPLLESADRPLHLAVATATVLDEPLIAAVRRADQRLASARAAFSAPDAPPTPAVSQLEALPQRTAKPGAAELRSPQPMVGEPAPDGQPEPREPRAAAD